MSRRYALPSIIVLLVLATGPAAAGAPPADSSGQVLADRYTPITQRVPSTPRWFTGTDDLVHLAYELLLTNAFPVPVTLTSVEVLDAERGGTVTALDGEALTASTTLLSGGPPLTELPPSTVVAVWIDLTFDDQVSLPTEVAHQVTVAVPPELGMTESVTVGARAEVDPRPPVVLGPPLLGPRWVAVGSCCDGPHRRALFPLNGGLHLAQRFAIDFNLLDAEGRFTVGDPSRNESAAGYGQPVIAVADAVVVAAVDRLPDQIPGDMQPVAFEGINGNHVVLDLGDGRFALYAHLKPGSVAVSEGDAVARGQIIGELGNSGNSTGAHLHFHVMDRPSPQVADGMPYVFDAFEMTGHTPPIDELLSLDDSQQPVPIDPAGSGPRQDALPLGEDEVAFPASAPPVAAGDDVALPLSMSNPRIEWLACATTQLPSQECGELVVPLSYREPDGATITLAVARVPALESSDRIGSLFLNPGGPGGSGVSALPVQYGALPAAVQERFDVVGFDPRGIGRSAPVQCFDSVDEATAFNWRFMSRWETPASPADLAEALAALEDFATRCGERNGDILAHVSTANVAQDLDRLRQAVGDERLNYLGTSYGTYLGATYANLFPDRIRAMALDGTVNPPSYTSFEHGDGDVAGPKTTAFMRVLSARASSEALGAFFAECAAAGAERCAFAAPTAEETRAKFDALMDRLRTAPATVTGPTGTLEVTYSFITHLVWTALYADPQWPRLAQALQLLSEGDTAGFFAAFPEVLAWPSPTGYVNTFDAERAVVCVDTDHPSDPADYQDAARSGAKDSPYFSAIWSYESFPCAFWPAEDLDRYEGPWDAETSATILIVSRVFDPATPHGGAVLAEETLGNARLLTIDGWGHGYFLAGKSTCADDATAAYLIDGDVPLPGTVCAQDMRPFGN